MASLQHFSLSRASADDLPELAKVEYDCFPPVIREVFMGCRSEADLPRLAEHYAKEMRENPSVIWVKVVDQLSRKIVAASQWKVFPGSVVPETADDKPAEWLEGEDLKRMTRIAQEMNEARRKANPGGYVHLHICFTHPDYRRRGAGGMMMRFGCDVADSLFLPAWIEASPEGNLLYRAFGFYDYEIKHDQDLGDSSNMRREPRHLERQA